MLSNCQLEHDKGSPEWARALLLDLSTDDWASQPRSKDLVEWLYEVAWNRVRRTGTPPRARRDLVQDTMSYIVVTLHNKRGTLATHDNPAAALERLVINSMRAAHHDQLMQGYGGVAKNGRNYGKAYPKQSIGFNIEESLAAPALFVHVDDRITAATRRLAEWMTRELGLKMTSAAFDATTYVLDRLCDGTSRSTLVRGGHSALGNDAAMRVLGFDHEAAGAFATWLLGRMERKIPGILDSAVLNVQADDLIRSRWRRTAITFGFAEPTWTPPPADMSSPHLAPSVARLIA
jgi:hypothetical protein